MKIYFACSITGGRQDEGMYQAIVQFLGKAGHEVPTAHIADTGVEEMDQKEDPGDIFHRDVNWIKESDLLVAEVSTPSHGVGYEIGYALSLDKPVLCLYQRNRKISKMISGNPHPLLTVQTYQNQQGAVKALKRFLSQLSEG
ncbi:MAG: nucleoside 2-deoxyribosyltransferase [Anaerolineales bacterium]